MDITLAIEQARQILDEERVAPTVRYVPTPQQDVDEITKGALAIAFCLDFQQLREQNPRNVLEDPRNVTFKSTNFELLRALHSQLSANDRPRFMQF